MQNDLSVWENPGGIKFWQRVAGPQSIGGDNVAECGDGDGDQSDSVTDNHAHTSRQLV